MNNDVLDEIATKEEVRAAIEAEAKNPSPRIAAASNWILRRNPRLKQHMTPLQLLSMAYEAILAERNWNKRVKFPKYVVGVMRSLAYNDTRKLKNTLPQIVYGADGQHSPAETDDRAVASPEEMMMEVQTAEIRIRKLKSLLNGDQLALEILGLLLEHGLTKAEIRSKLGIPDTKFWSADRKIQRAIEKLGDE